MLTLLGMPRAQSLFHSVYSLSGPPTSATLEAAEALGRTLAELGGVAPTVAGLSTLPEERVLELQGQVSSLGGDVTRDGNAPADPLAGIAGFLNAGLVLGPVVDGDLIPLATADALASGIGADKHLILGTTDDEFAMVLAGAGDSMDAIPAAAVLAGIGVEPATIEAYVADHEGLGTADLVGQYITDLMFRAPTLDLAEIRASIGAPTWVYRFSWGAHLGACHCIDVPFMWDVLADEHVPAIAGAEAPQALADDIHGSSVAFIATGQPGWAAYDNTDRAVRAYNVPTSIIADGYGDARSLVPVRVG